MSITQNTDPLNLILTAGGILAKSAAKTTVLHLFRHVILNQPDHVIERVFNSFSLGKEYNDKKLQCGETIRADWYFENDNNIKFVEDLVKQIISDTQGKKSEHITKFHVNIRFSSNDDIDEHTAFSFLETIDSLSWRQLCIIRLIVLNKNQKLDHDYIRYMAMEEIDKLSDDQRMAYHSISREYRELMDKQYVEGAAVPILRGGEENTKWNSEPCLRFPGSGDIPYSIKRLHDLMDLNEIPDKEIMETFSIWNVRII